MRLTLSFLIMGFVLGLGVSCNQSGVGILHSIRNEEAYLDTSLDNDLTILSFDVLPDFYIAVTGEVQVRSQTGSDIDWDTATLPTTDYIATSAAVFGEVLYVTVTGSDRAGVAGSLYQFDPDPTADPVWTTIDVDSDLETDTGIIKVLEYSGGILVTSASEDSDVEFAYNAFVSSDGSTFTELSIPAETNQVVDVEEYSGNFWVIAGNALYVGGSGSLVAVVAAKP